MQMLVTPPKREDDARKAALAADIRAARRAVLVVNTRSRNGRTLYARARARLAERGVTLDATYAVRDAARLPEIVRELLRERHRLVFVGGGDGTISSIVDDFAYRDAVLAILPLGTANSFARALGLPLDVDAAIDVALDGKLVDVDLGTVNDNHFANAAAIGLPASIARGIAPTLKQTLGRIGYLLTAAVRLVRHRPFHCTLHVGGRSISFDALEVRIANGAYQGGVEVAGDAHPESRDLVVQAVTGVSRWSLVRFWLRAALKLPLRVDNVEVVRARDLRLETTPQEYVSIDGEAVAQTPVRARVVEQALLVMVPHERADLR